MKKYLYIGMAAVLAAGMVAGMGWFLHWRLFARGIADKGGDVAEKKGQPKFTISKETTYVIGSRTAYGHIDYLAALNERMRQGVTPANNANVMLWKAFGPHPGNRTMPPQYFAWMEVQTPPEQGNYFIELSQYVKEHVKLDPGKAADEFNGQLVEVSQRPWTLEQYPHVAAWLIANEEPLAVVVAAAKRSDYFSPLEPGKTEEGAPKLLLGASMTGVQQYSQAGVALAARSMLRVAQGRDEDAWQDLLALHRLGRLVARGGTMIEGLVGINLERVASNADLAFLDRTRFNANQIKDCLRDLQKLPPMPLMADKVDLTERLTLLDNLTLISRIHSLDVLRGTALTKLPGLMPRHWPEDIDWDPTLRAANRLFDRMAAAMRETDRRSREKQLNQIDEALQTQKKKAEDLQQALGAEQTAEGRGKLVGDVLLPMLAPNVHKVQQGVDRSEQVGRNLYLAFGLTAYRRDHGHYPLKLDLLAPKYLAHIPQDLFTGKTLSYRASENGYLLYSVGPNGKDEEGRGPNDKPSGDDLSVRIPFAELRQK